MRNTFKRNKGRRIAAILLAVLLLPVLFSCEILDIRLTEMILNQNTDENVFSSETGEASGEKTVQGGVTEASDRYTVVFEENEEFDGEAEKKASLRIDPAIKKAVKLLNTTGGKTIQISDCDYDKRPKQRDTLKYELSKEVYDKVLEAVRGFEDYRFSQKDHPGVDLFNIFVSAMDALKIDHTEIFLYSDGKIDGDEYYSGYFMPGDWLNDMCDDREAVRAEVEFCNAVVDRILEKMPQGMTNYEKCFYFALVLAAANEYDYSDDIFLYDYQAYSAFVKGKAICSGYAQAFYRLCRDEGISCRFCRGETPSGRHAWNKLDTPDGPVYVDVTWYDTEKLDNDYREGNEQYLFMNVEDFDYYGYVMESFQ